jgi:hypothetical protein
MVRGKERTYQSGGLGDKVQACVKLSKLMMTAGRVGDDLNAFLRMSETSPIEFDVKIHTCQSIWNVRSLQN